MTGLKIWLRNIVANKTTYIITYGGFAVSISVLLILFAYIAEELSVDKSYRYLNYIYRVADDKDYLLVDDDCVKNLVDIVPEINTASRFTFADNQEVLYDNSILRGDLILADDSFYEIFTLNFSAGNKKNVFEDINSIVLTKSFAAKVFGNKNPIGEVITIAQEYNLTVVSIIDDFPQNSSIHADMICPADLRIVYASMTIDGIENYMSKLFLLIRPGSDILKVEEKVSQAIINIHKLKRNERNFKLLPFDEAYFYQNIPGDNLKHANIELIVLLSTVAVIILLLSVLNYINLITSSNLSRIKEFGIKKTSGAGRKEIFLQIISETFYGIIFSLVLGFVLAEIFGSYFIPVFGRTIDLHSLLSQPLFMAALFLMLSAVTFLTGFYPAYLASKINPVTLLGGGIVKTKGSWFRNLLNTVQFSISIVMIIFLFFVIEQIDYVKNINLGFDTEKLLNINLHWRLGEKSLAIKNKLLSHQGIKSVTVTHGIPGAIRIMGGGYTSYLHVDSDFIETFKMQLIEGRNFFPAETAGEICILNEAAIRKLELIDPVGKLYGRFKIVGVVKDFHFNDLHKKISPLVITLNNINSYSNITARFNSANISELMAYIREVWNEMAPTYDFEYTFYDDWFDSMYKQEEQTASAVKLFAIIAIIISCLGLYGLAEMSAKTRIKEIGIRKTLGASSTSILLLLNRKVVNIVLIAFVIAIPFGYFIINKWMEKFAYKIDIGWMEFILSGLLLLILALLTVSVRTLQASARNPIDALKYE